MTPQKIHVDEPGEVQLIFERDTTPKLDLALYEDEDQTVEVDVSDFTFEAYFKAGLDVDNEDAPLQFQDSDILRNPNGENNVIRIPISHDDTLDSDILLPSGVVLIYWTDSNGHRERLIRGTFEARK